MSRIRANEIAALRRAAEQYEDIKRVVAQIVNANPNGLQIRPLFGQRPRNRTKTADRRLIAIHTRKELTA